MYVYTHTSERSKECTKTNGGEAKGLRWRWRKKEAKNFGRFGVARRFCLGFAQLRFDGAESAEVGSFPFVGGERERERASVGCGVVGRD